MPQQTPQYFGNGRKFSEAFCMPDSSSQHPQIAIIAKCLRRRMTSHGQSGPNLRLFTRIDVSELGQSKEPLHSRAVGMVGLVLTQCDVAARLGIRP